MVIKSKLKFKDVINHNNTIVIVIKDVKHKFTRNDFRGIVAESVNFESLDFNELDTTYVFGRELINKNINIGID